MTSHRPLSDQLYTWSASYAGQNLFQPATAPQSPPAGTTPFGRHPTRLFNRTLQTLRKTRLQMRQRPWPRSKILSLHQSNRRTPSDGLRTPGLSGASQTIPGQSSTRPDHLGRDLRHQSRTPAPPGEALKGAAGERNGQYAHRHPRYSSGCDPDRQHAHVALRRRQSYPGGQP